MSGARGPYAVALCAGHSGPARDLEKDNFLGTVPLFTTCCMNAWVPARLMGRHDRILVETRGGGRYLVVDFSSNEREIL